jgi:YidC/Oxa1 family membrane protein insertase
LGCGDYFVYCNHQNDSLSFDSKTNGFHAKNDSLAAESTSHSEKYGHDKQKMNQKIMELYSEEKASPYSGCLPLLVQLPILWIFYKALFDLTARASTDPSFEFLGFNITQTYGLALDYHLILPIIAAVTTYLMTKVSMANTPQTATNNTNNQMAASAQQTQKIMLYIMPLFMAYIVITLPSGLGIYIVTMNIVSILQTLYIYKVLLNREEKKAKLKAEQ